MGRPMYLNAMWVHEDGVGAETVELGVVDGALLVYPIVDERGAFGSGRDHCEEREIINIKSGIRSGMYLFREGDEVRGFDMDIDELGDAVLGYCGVGEREHESHLLEHRELHFEKLDRCAAYGERGVGCDGGRKEEHGIGRVLGDRIGDVHRYLRLPVDGERGRADAFDTHTKIAQVSADFLDLVVGGCVLDDGG